MTLIQFDFCRTEYEFLREGEKLKRELKHLYNLKCLETHKIAVIYIGEDQYDKMNILSNETGSYLYDDFVSRLGTLVKLKEHKGFAGGLLRNGQNGIVAPYYCTPSLLQVIFHVSTLLQPSSEFFQKMKHIGNDEVHIVWCECKMEYSSEIIPTKFGEVTIVIYPLYNALFSIQIIKKTKTCMFGPLCDGAVVDGLILPDLIRLTAINAGRALREMRNFYQNLLASIFSI
ncbi:hypothetical protein HELRODRAFT_67405 [Helobdella robusta]|uniref:Rap-GAP domain-containing protein n=1 Tax=Helobdella robusta TaxID=6412 RepID=T1FZ02_HELRO|nr:hypothetical protein HELRODRAFT_67405 [Helobdella robusta]ESN98877.1 hypothetical protein HELRODRAFT_67405 [Helobdella robusta]